MHFPRMLDLRQDSDKSQKEIAALLGIDQRTYSNYETGKREIPVHLLIVLADFYGTTIDYIVGRDVRPRRLR
nr:helix-turn-helix transcriptional regulator [Flintibacter muris]